MRARLPMVDVEAIRQREVDKAITTMKESKIKKNTDSKLDVARKPTFDVREPRHLPPSE